MKKSSKNIIKTSIIGMGMYLVYKHFSSKPKVNDNYWDNIPKTEYNALVDYILSKTGSMSHPSFSYLFSKITAIQSYIQFKVNQRCDTEFHRNLYLKDAFRHIYWSALMTKLVSGEYSEKIGNAHEDADKNNFPLDREMDLWNNKLGRDIGTVYSNSTIYELGDLSLNAISLKFAKILKPNKKYEIKVIEYMKKKYSKMAYNKEDSIKILTEFYKLLYKNKNELYIDFSDPEYKEYSYNEIEKMLGVLFIM